MKRLFTPSIFALLFILVLAVTVSGQQNDADTQESALATPIEIALDSAEGTLGINHEMTVMAEAELNIGGQLYKLSVPATVMINTEQLLAEAGAITNIESHVGPFSWVVTEVIEGDEFEEGYLEVEASGDDNQLVVVRFDITNMANETMSIWEANVAVFGVDDLGKVYESTKNDCDDIDPGDTQSCLWIFDVPADVNMVDTKIEALQTRQLSLSAVTAE